eukprot:5541032-Amphidinium_carterae.1
MDAGKDVTMTGWFVLTTKSLARLDTDETSLQRTLDLRNLRKTCFENGPASRFTSSSSGARMAVHPETINFSIVWLRLEEAKLRTHQHIK